MNLNLLNLKFPDLEKVFDNIYQILHHRKLSQVNLVIANLAIANLVILVIANLVMANLVIQ